MTHSKEWNEVQARLDAEFKLYDRGVMGGDEVIDELLNLYYTIIAPDGTYLRAKLPEGVTE